MRSKLERKELASSALGDNVFHLVPMRGRVDVDLMKNVQGNPSFQLPSYKLDDVSAHFMRGAIVASSLLDNQDGEGTRLVCKSTVGLLERGFVKIVRHDGIIENSFMNGRKFLVTNVTADAFDVDADVELDGAFKYFWCEAKDDVSVADIFRLQEEGPEGRATVAKYCVQDCALVLRLFNKLDVLTNNLAMGNVCGVPFSYLFLRGQGVKVFSLVARQVTSLCLMHSSRVRVKHFGRSDLGGVAGALGCDALGVLLLLLISICSLSGSVL